ncbi:MAG: hypothetical protein K1X78_15060 [Verrucomicrobiaceae bacterium]|nr:hypothetical protein [Verrucomicrobiaceae bacterium]
MKPVAFILPGCIRDVVVMGRFIIAFLSFSTLAFSGDARPNLTPPYRLMYGYKDLVGFKPQPFWSDTKECERLWDEVFGRFNIITGKTTDAAVVKRLRERGMAFAYSVSNNRNATHKTAEDFVREWSKPLEDTLGGQLPGGFDGISIDELHGDTDGSADSEITIKAVREVRRRFPNKLMLTWAPMAVVLAGSPDKNGVRYAKGKVCDNQFRMVAECCDLLMIECYQRESSKHLDWFAEAAKNLNTRAPGLLSKSVFGLCVSQREDLNMDDKADVDFAQHVEKQFQILQTEPVVKQTPGVAIYSFYRAKPELIPTINRLIGQYYPATRR